jgi:membrane protein DedA with SNARE-associated domain
MVPALLPPPAPFKLFVLLAGVAGVSPVRFITAIGVARGARYLILGGLAIWYGDLALEYMRTHGRAIALSLIGLVVAAAVGWWAINRRRPET